jgi:hypothetical protein
MRRRDFIVGLGAAAWPLTTLAQATRLPNNRSCFCGQRDEETR